VVRVVNTASWLLRRMRSGRRSRISQCGIASALQSALFMTGKRHSHWVKGQVNINGSLCGGKAGRGGESPASVGIRTPVLKPPISRFIY
jgi:hypothetical protein